MITQLQKREKIVNGYVLVYEPNHPFNKHGYAQAHRIRVENFIGRYLKPEEVVHHLDQNKQNNSINNLMIFPNQKAHVSFHIRFAKFGLNQLIRRMIAFRWKEYKEELL